MYRRPARFMPCPEVAYTTSSGTLCCRAVVIPPQRIERPLMRSGLTPMARIKAGTLTTRLKQWVRTKGLKVSPHCQKRRKGANARCKCTFCPPLFTSRVAARPEADGTYKPISRQQVSDCVKQSMRAIGVSPESRTA